MTFATQLTVFRILMIPVFVLFCVYYGESVSQGRPEEWLRLTAIGVFILASITDGLDGYIADKGLLLTAIITLSLSNWNQAFPLWFPIIVIARDAVILSGCGVLYLLDQHLEVKPSWTGKTATALQMLAIAWLMLQIPFYLVTVYVAGLFTLVSGIDYLYRGLDQLRHHSNPS
jgi:phosphatidylglycerophosphate synthase